MPLETSTPRRQVHIVGGGPVGLILTALLQAMGDYDIRLYEKRTRYSRTRMVKLDTYLVADSVESYCIDYIDEENVEAVFDRTDLEEGVASRKSIPPDLRSLLLEWTLGFCPLNAIEQALSDLIDQRGTRTVTRVVGELTAQDALDMTGPDDILIDCTGSRSLLRDHISPAFGGDDGDTNVFKVRLEYALVITFLYSQTYVCDEYCKYYKNAENESYKFIPAVHRTYYDQGVSHVTGIVNITEAEFQAMPTRFDAAWLRDHLPGVTLSMDRFIDRITHETGGEIVGELEAVRIPLDLYHARNVTSRKWHALEATGHPFANAPAYLAGDSAIGSPYFQSISLGFECAMFLAGLIGQRDLPLRDAFDRYENFMYKQWLRVYMRSKMIKHNKDLFETLDDTFALLEKLHIY
jgi:2-polyprenyl-6-methoxyphenol hydroxylase-like FAD-dependent oxidoreductase